MTEGEKALAAFLALGMSEMVPSPWRVCQSGKAGKLTNAVFMVRQPTHELLPTTN